MFKFNEIQNTLMLFIKFQLCFHKRNASFIYFVNLFVLIGG